MDQTREEKSVAKLEDSVLETEGKKGFSLKILLIGLPIFVIQLIAVYFVTTNILLPRIQINSVAGVVPGTKENKPVAADASGPKELGKFVYIVEDLIINPANTDGKRLLLSTLGFDVPTEQDQQELKSKEVVLKDAVISVMSSKELSQLGNMAYRDTLRLEISNKLKQVIPKVKINTIYFSKYILQ